MALTDNLISHWKLNEASGTRVDSHGSNNLADINTVTSSTGVIGDAASFTSASSESLDIGTNTSLELGTDTAFTFSFWVNFTSADNFRALISKAGTGDGTNDEYNIDLDSNAYFRLYVGNSSTFAAVSATAYGVPATGTWLFVVAWHDPTADTLNLQINNGTVYSATWTGGTYTGTARFKIGRYPNNASSDLHHNGLIDSVSFWKRTLTSDERTSLYNSGSGLDYESFSGGAASTARSYGYIF